MSVYNFIRWTLDAPGFVEGSAPKRGHLHPHRNDSNVLFEEKTNMNFTDK